ncbi:chromosomal replication initiation protein [Methylobacterium sp. Leaf99]|uniref:chromosomal replication initiator protein DnaA n=1 Tax=unclassified Methylobacterium TaxID=2615210 RepID=UPI0006FC8065|nr:MULTISPECIES: chromosomal replication initiator protein DnaA [unclassified Methylobacterium]KQP06755.1 chromosomal replication initiation protein [Methylobacterium sp. Leaf99]TXM71741.1 chromosomal replication initiator protein DnaA [Methylobacterium sp. WL69]
MHVDGSVSGNAETGMSGVSGTDPVAAWARVKRRLRAELGEDVFASWFARLELLEVSGATARLTVPTRFLKSWIESHYIDRVLNTFRSEVEDVSRIDVSVRGPAAARPAATASAAQKPAMAPSPLARLQAAGSGMQAPSDSESDAPVSARAEGGSGDLNGAPLDNRLTFTSFVVGRSNALAHAAGERVARHDGQGALYNPLYLHAGVGLGKTHLLHAIGHAARDSGRRVIYLTADRFMYGFVNALKTQNALAFKERLRAIDLLILDDVQFIQGKSIQAEFGHTINALIDAGRQVVVASDRPPTELEALEERVRSRLAGGLVVEIGTLDEQLRTSILSARLAAVQVSHPSFEVSPTVATYVARAITANGRDLEGAVNRLLAHATLTGAAVTMETAEAAIRDLVKNREPKRIKIEDIQKLVASRYNVSRSDILSERRTAAVVKPRQIAMYLSKVLTLRSLPEIGRRFGGRDHTTVLHAVRKIDKLIGEDNVLNDEVELLKRMLQD